MFNIQDFALSFGLKGKLRLDRTWNQNFVMASILFCLPGMYLALTGLGAGGGQPTSQHVVSTSSAITFGVFAITGWLGGTVLNFIKPKAMIMFAATGYPLYIGSLWYFDLTGNVWFPYFAGVILGLTAGMLWTAAGFIAFAYGTEDQKARFISWQWATTSLGGTVGSLVAFGINFNATTEGVPEAVYIVFLVIQCMAVVIAFLFIIDPKHVTRDDGTHIAIFPETNLGLELQLLFRLFSDWKVWVLIPGMVVAEMNLTLISIINAYYFNLRTRSLNNVCLQLIEVPLPLMLSAIMDTSLIKSRRTRGLLGIAIVSVIALGTCSGSMAWIVENHVDHTPQGVDWTDERFGAAFTVFLFESIVYGIYQIAVQWVLGALTNDPDTCARYSGLFKGTTGLGLMISFLLDSQGVSFVGQKTVHFVLYSCGVVALFIIVGTQIRETNYFLEKNVIVPHKFEQMLKADGAVTDEQTEKEKQKEELAAQIDEKGGRTRVAIGELDA